MSTGRFVAALIAASGTTSGTIAVTDAADVVAIVGSTPGAVAVVDAGDVVAVTGYAASRGSIAVADAADTPAVTGTAGSTSNNIRLQPGLALERGGYAASLTGLRWWVLNSALTAVEASGTGATTNASGQITIDINTSASYVVGDYVPLWIASYNSGTAAPDRTVLSGMMFVQAIAQS